MRWRGIGTIVAPQPVRRAVALTSLNDDLKEACREPEICVLAFEEARCPPDIAEHLGLEPGAPVLSFDRLRLANSGAHVPIALMHNVLPTGLLTIEEKTSNGPGSTSYSAEARSRRTSRPSASGRAGPAPRRPSRWRSSPATPC